MAKDCYKEAAQKLLYGGKSYKEALAGPPSSGATPQGYPEADDTLPLEDADGFPAPWNTVFWTTMQEIAASSFNHEMYMNTYTVTLPPDGFECLGSIRPMSGDFIEVTDSGIWQRIWRHTCCFKKTPPLVHFWLFSEDYDGLHPYALMWLDHDESELRPRRLLPLSAIDISVDQKERSIKIMLANGKWYIFKVYKPEFEAYNEEDLEEIVSNWEELITCKMTLNDTKLTDKKGNNEREENYERDLKITEDELQDILVKQLNMELPVVSVTVNEVPMQGILGIGAPYSLLDSKIFFRHWTRDDLILLHCSYNFTPSADYWVDVKVLGFLKAHIKIQGHVYYNKILVVENLSTSILIGMDLISNMNKNSIFNIIFGSVKAGCPPQLQCQAALHGSGSSGNDLEHNSLTAGDMDQSGSEVPGP
ncbi:uncharacterized protein LOC143927145 [Lithobates pipiens]